ncbi:MAG: carboxylating nicotinate-nucleotide diphosphorylase [Thermoanaerobaculia bacterium]|nr:carboxylating nicotinate-nucleotide diphosphorylase [Thermoanaerobaculia bacterium]
MPAEEERLDVRLREFLAEDIGGSDVTTDATVPPGQTGRAEIVAKSDCVVSGLDVARRTFALLDPGILWEPDVRDGDRVTAGSRLARLSGPARPILTGERVALNLLQRMSGIATATRRYVDAVAGTSCRILDTRKTAPGLRTFDRIAVLSGGGHNHRSSLSEMVLIKDNHRRLAGGVSRAVTAARERSRPGMKIEVEVESEQDLREALEAGTDAILVDNQTPATVANWVAIVQRHSSRPTIEASGGITLENVRAYALAGADCVSVGALTHSVRAADVSLELYADA